MLAVELAVYEVRAGGDRCRQISWTRTTSCSIAEIASMFGTVLLAGFFRKLVGQAHGGGGVVTVRRIVRTLPLARLVAADTLGRRPRDGGLVWPC